MIIASETDLINLLPPWPLDKYNRMWSMDPALDEQAPWATSEFSAGNSSFTITIPDNNCITESPCIYRDDFCVRINGSLLTTLTLIYRHTVPGALTTMHERLITDVGELNRTSITDVVEDDGRIKRTAVFEYAGKISYVQVVISAFYGSGDAVDITDMGLYRGRIDNTYEPAPPHVPMDSKLRLLSKSTASISSSMGSWADDLPIIYSGTARYYGASVNVIELLEAAAIRPHPGMMYRIVFDTSEAPYKENIAVDRITEIVSWTGADKRIKTTSTAQGPLETFHITIYDCTYMGTDALEGESKDRTWDDGHTHQVLAAITDDVVVPKWTATNVGNLTRPPLQMTAILQYEHISYRLLVQEQTDAPFTYWWGLDQMPQAMLGAVFDPNLPRKYFNAKNNAGVELDDTVAGHQIMCYFWNIVPGASADSGYYLDVAYPTPPYSAFRLIMPLLRKYTGLADLFIV